MNLTFFIPHWGHWPVPDPKNPFAQGLGGEQSAAIRMAQELAKRGNLVSIYAPGISPTMDDGVMWFPANQKESYWREIRPDVLVSCAAPGIFRAARGRLNVCTWQCAAPYPNDKIGPVLGRAIDHHFVLSNYQRHTLTESDKGFDPMKAVVFGNGVDLDRYDKLMLPRVSGRMVWSSSPDRGLHHLLRWWPEIKTLVPHASLKVFYGTQAMERHRWSHGIEAEWARVIDEGKSLADVEFVGMVDQARLAREQLRAQLFAYPCDTAAPTETFCITALEMAAARTPLLLAKTDCLEEVYGPVGWTSAHMLAAPPNGNEWIPTIAALLNDHELARKYVNRARLLAETLTWERLAARWQDFFERRLQAQTAEEILDLIDDVEERVRQHA